VLELSWIEPMHTPIHEEAGIARTFSTSIKGLF
jgi:hypothetical protein